MKRPNIGTEGGLPTQCVSSDSSSVHNALRADCSAREGENSERLQSAQRVKELVGRLRLILKAGLGDAANTL